jgi:gamma-glutamylcyclotransferase
VSLVWYFAYGSNMETATFRGRREIDFVRAVPARAAGWRLVFDKPAIIPMGEGFANIVPDPGAAVLGVLYEITETDLAHVELTEGVHVGNYRRAVIQVTRLAGSAEPLAAATLVSDRRAPELQPTRPYMARLIAGAEEHGLPGDYVAFLRAVPAGEETAEGKRVRALIDAALRKPR